MRQLVVVAALVLVVGTMPADAAPAIAPPGPPSLACVQRVQIPNIANPLEAKWSPGSQQLAVSWFGRIPSTRTVSGYAEQELIDILDLRTGTLWPVGVGDVPRWSTTGTYLSYWGPDSVELRIVKDSHLVARVWPTIPETRWVGDQLFFIEKSDIREWENGAVRTLAHLPDALAPKYPSDDVYWSGDATTLTLTRYSLDGTLRRYLITTQTGAITPIDDARYTEWAPQGATLLVRTLDRVQLRDIGGSTESFAIPSQQGLVHEWAPDGHTLLVGRVSPVLPGGDAFDEFRVAGASGGAPNAILPNLLGERTFSADGRYFVGTSRTGTHTTRLEVYGCGAALDAPRDLGDSPARLQTIEKGPGRFVRPAAGEITQFVQGIHTGIDVAEQFGSLITADDDGTITFVEWVNVGGNRVCVQHAGALESCVYHTSLPLVAVGDRVVRGQPIALIGMTGVTTGPHTHWEVKLGGRIVDPLTF